MKRCPFVSTRLECFAGGYGNLNCLNPDYHEGCKHKEKHMKRGAE